MYWLLGGIAAFVLLCYFVLRQEADSTGGDFSAFVKATDPNKPKAKRTEDSFDETYTTPGRQVLILYATAYGFAEVLGKKLYTRVKKEAEASLNLQPRLVHMKDAVDFVDLTQETTVFIIASTAGDGVPPSDSRDFFDYISSNKVGLAHLNFAVLALGDTAYPHFCRAGRTLDARFLELGAQPMMPRVDVDREDWGLIDGWMDSLLTALGDYGAKPEQLDYLASRKPAESASKFSRTNPFLAELKVKRCLTELGRPDDKEIIHAEFDLADSGLTYTAGDAIGVVPTNKPEEVDALLKAWGRTGKERVFTPVQASLRETLMDSFDLKQVKTSLLSCLLKDSSPSPIEAQKLEAILAAGDSKTNEPLQKYLHHREIIDVLQDFPKASKNLTIRNMLAHLRNLQPRYYSISSTPVITPGVASVTAAVVRYALYGTARTGVCTTFLSERSEVGSRVPVFISQNPDFRLPADPSRPVIMVGPGTGLAPFRAFVHERVAKGATGRTTLYFGCRHRERDFTYRDELEALAAQGQLNLRCAFSRDQAAKVYVQHLIEQDGAQIAADLLAGGHFYICGDGAQMAVDVTRALEAVLQKHVPAVRSLQDAQDFIRRLETEGRFEKDVWIT